MFIIVRSKEKGCSCALRWAIC